MAYARSYDSAGFVADLTALFRHQLAACALVPGEFCLAITDTAWMPAYGAACMAAADALGSRSMLVTFGWSAAPDSAALEAMCSKADLIVYMTTHPLHYRPEIGRALARGARALCCMEPPHVLDRLRFDPVVRDRAIAGAAALDTASVLRITSPAGTDLTMDKTGRRGLGAYGAADRPGHLDFWGLGAVQAAQVEGTTEGTLVLDVGDCLFHLARFVESPVRIHLSAGRITGIEGGLDAFLLREVLTQAGDDGAWLAGHMAWGIDARARWTQPITQTPDAGGGGADIESFAGAVQVQFGSNDDMAFGGRNRSRAHIGLCLRGATLTLDGVAVVSMGRIAPVTPGADGATALPQA
jgi:2,5-dihydroxypyridine 5,6-dioxygenase